MTNELFGHVIKVHIEGDYKADFTNDKFHIEFESPFDDDEKPNETKIMIYNLSTNSISRIKKGANLTLQAGYRSDYGVITEGTIDRTLTEQDGVDKITSIYLLEGKDYSDVEVTAETSTNIGSELRIAFKAGTKASVIIRTLVKDLGFQIADMKLPTDKIYSNGYTATGQILNNLTEVVKDCGASMYWRRGKMIIRSIKEGDDERFVLESSTGLTESPEPFEEEDAKGFNVKSLLQHRITTASIIELKSRTANGKYRAKKGKHVATSSDFRTEVQVI